MPLGGFSRTLRSAVEPAHPVRSRQRNVSTVGREEGHTCGRCAFIQCFHVPAQSHPLEFWQRERCWAGAQRRNFPEDKANSSLMILPSVSTGHPRSCKLVHRYGSITGSDGAASAPCFNSLMVAWISRSSVHRGARLAELLPILAVTDKARNRGRKPDKSPLPFAPKQRVVCRRWMNDRNDRSLQALTTRMPSGRPWLLVHALLLRPCNTGCAGI